MTVRVVSYNLLVPIYADRPEYYFKCQTQFLKTDYRWNLIQSQLEQEIVHQENTIICLQELSLPMLSKLELFFRRLNYSFFHNLYGGRHNDYMGVGMAIPVSMQLNSISFIKIGDHIRSISKLREKKTNLFTWGWDLYQFALSKFIQTVSDPWTTAMARANTLICLQLVIDGKPLCVGTYHMPCLYKEPGVMAIHSSIVKDLMFQLAGGEDFILAGDFNLKPSDTCYQALTEKGSIDINFPKSNSYDISYRPNTEQILKSAYREKNGLEPVYTDFVDTLTSTRFCETLDYIFFSGHLTVEKVLGLPDHSIGESYPDETHPSDHLMIAATFRLL
jgi:mRNA deadenylase 3'-5' endonuclease subunit Ccr4